MLGEQFHVPPPYSAKKVGGIRSYHLARQGIEVTLAARRVHIAQLKFVQRQANEVDFEIHCSAGTYIRSIAHELGKKLACGAHLTRLRRITAGEFYLDRAITLDSFITSSWTELSKHFISVNAVLRALPELEVDAAIQISLNHGNDFGIRTRYLQIKSNYKNLETFMTTKVLNCRQAHWPESLASYDFILVYIKGTKDPTYRPS